MNNDLEILNNDDVVSFVHSRGNKFDSGNTLKTMQLLEEYKRYVMENERNKNSENWRIYDLGVECDVLKQDGNYKGWRKGKIKFVIQFEPDEPDEIENNDNPNSLDDIRKQINTTNQ